MYRVVILSLMLFSSLLYSYERPEHISPKIWNQVSPYFLPEEHPIKHYLDEIFLKRRTLHSKQEVAESDFTLLEDKEYDLMVAKHSQFPGYLIKFYYDYHEVSRLGTRGEWPLWIKRIQGIGRVKRSIAAHKFGHLVKVPQKWIYPLPPEAVEPFPYEDGRKNFRKNFILVEEDMEIVPATVNQKMYQNMSQELLVALYTILNETQLYDSVYIDNNPFSKDGKLTFVDTEEYDLKGVLYERITPYLSFHNQELWQALISGDYPMNLVEAQNPQPDDAAYQ